MIHLGSVVYNALVNPLVSLFVILLIGYILRLLKHKRFSNILIYCAFLFFCLVSTTPLSQWIVYTLERQYLPLDTERISRQELVHILVLGGGHSIAPEHPSVGQLSSSATNRLAEGIRLYYEFSGAKLIGSGYSASGRKTHAQTLAEAAVQLGVLPEDTLQSRTPGNTEEEIKAYIHRFGRNVPLILITSAYHMPRAMLICKRNALRVVPAPTDFYLKRDPKRSSFNFYPSAEKLIMFERAMHEYGGIVKLKLFAP